jgi:hypothetical protein
MLGRAVQEIVDMCPDVLAKGNPELILWRTKGAFYLICNERVVRIARGNHRGLSGLDDRKPLAGTKPVAIEPGQQLGRYGSPLVVFYPGAAIVLGKGSEEGASWDIVFVPEDPLEVKASTAGGDGGALERFRAEDPFIHQRAKPLRFFSHGRFRGHHG